MLHGKLHIQRFKEAAMGMKLKYVTSLLAAGSAAVVIATAPTAFARDHQSCNGSGSETVCQSLGNVPINTAPPQVQHHPHGDPPDLTVRDLGLALGLAS
jgi:hypothetical protein